MNGTLLLIPAEVGKPRRLTLHSKPPTWKQLQDLLGGPFELVPEFETIQLDAQLRDCIALCPSLCPDEPFNQWGTLLWGMSLVRKYGLLRANPGDHIRGPVLIITGDREFLGAL
jgi:hypothetical protein